MKKIININLSGRVIPIEDAAYENLKQYIESLRRYFAGEEGRDEIINDIESRIAELMNDKVRKGSAAITEADIQEITASMGSVRDFEEADAAERITSEKTTTDAGAGTGAGASAGAQTYTQPRFKGRLYRNEGDKLLGGVCSGLAAYMNVDPSVVRLLFAIITFGGFGMGVLIYIILWIVLPASPLTTYTGKRLFRNPEDRIIGGVAGGLGAYFNKPAWNIRLIFAAPLILNIIFGIFDGPHDVFPNLFFGSFTGTFILTYIILWIVLPEARSPFEKMEMRGEKVDVNSIKNNVQEGMTDFKTRMQAWSEEVKTSAQNLTNRANDFTQTHARPFASDVKATAAPLGRGIGHAIGVIFRVFFLFVAGCIALMLFAIMIALIFGGVAWGPVNNFLWSSPFQQAMAWGTVIFFFAVPVVGFITWLVRRIVSTRSKSKYLGWTFSGLWTIGWICAISLTASIARDIRKFERTATDVAISQPITNGMLVKVVEPRIRYTGGMWGFDDDNGGWDVNEDTLRYNNVKLRMTKSEDSAYHVTIYKYSAGNTVNDAMDRAGKTQFTAYTLDSILNIGSGLRIDRTSKFRGQKVLVEVKVPVGKKIKFDESLVDTFEPWVVRYEETGSDRRWNRRYRVDWDWDESFSWTPGVDYVMTSEGTLITTDKVINNPEGVYEKRSNTDSLRRQIEQQEKDLQEDRERLRDLEERRRDSIRSTTLIKPKKPKKETQVQMYTAFVPLII